MMLDKLPGTALDFDERGASNAFSVIAPILDATGGLTLSQLATLTGLEGSTIQNWIKRGWVAPTVGKKYGERQVVRIMLINILRGTIKLEDIARLMEYINGEVDDLSDDIMHDTELYNLMCQMLTAMTRDNLHSREEIDEEIEKRLDRSFEGENRKRLRRVLLIMILGYRASYYRRMAENEFAELEYEY
ncbi:DNA polymerase III alpha subunit [Ruminococcaceae bacterium FB2012]|nr:DNA polymerase III alpha subunit [Ruminococcaceae bacterium FB2012]